MTAPEKPSSTAPFTLASQDEVEKPDVQMVSEPKDRPGPCGRTEGIECMRAALVSIWMAGPGKDELKDGERLDTCAPPAVCLCLSEVHHIHHMAAYADAGHRGKKCKLVLPLRVVADSRSRVD